MGRIKGQVEYEKWQNGIRISRKQAMLAQCYECNGLEASNSDCQGKHCPMYSYNPYKGKKAQEDAREVIVESRA